MRYFHLNKEKMRSLGKFPAVGLAEAKAARDDARKLLARGTDPGQKRRDDKAATLMAQENSFRVLAEEWLFRQTDRAESIRKKSQWLLGFAIADFGQRPIRDITPQMVLTTCRKLEHQGK